MPEADAASISPGVLRDTPPLPPATTSPDSCSSPRSPSLSAPQTVVVTPELCQSKPRTAPNAWNHAGSDSRTSISPGPYSLTMASVISRASRRMRENSQAGALPP